jgi:16S rRNA (guanine527-N7)-methyltransferase
LTDAAPADEASVLIATAAASGATLSVEQAGGLSRYLDLLQRWNATYNLTAVRQRGEMLTQHLADCLAVIAPLARCGARGRLLDVGSGGGLPGVVIAVALPGWEVTCVDTVGKKAAFVRQVAGALRLPNLRAEHARAETLAQGGYDVVTARAFSTLSDLVRVTRRLLAPGGVWMAMKGRAPQEEIAALPPEVEMFHVEPLTVPGLAAERCLVWMRPQESR